MMMKLSSMNIHSKKIYFCFDYWQKKLLLTENQNKFNQSVETLQHPLGAESLRLAKGAYLPFTPSMYQRVERILMNQSTSNL